jgi:hypothetical protein
MWLGWNSGVATLECRASDGRNGTMGPPDSAIWVILWNTEDGPFGFPVDCNNRLTSIIIDIDFCRTHMEPQ